MCHLLACSYTTTLWHLGGICALLCFRIQRKKLLQYLEMKFLSLWLKPSVQSLCSLDNFPGNLQWMNLILLGKSQLPSTRLQSGLYVQTPCLNLEKASHSGQYKIVLLRGPDPQSSTVYKQNKTGHFFSTHKLHSCV